jgi:hypothetical protein
MRYAKIDDAILSNVGGSWKKIAMVIVKVSSSHDAELSEDEEEFDVIAKHIEVLVAEGRLEVQGNVKNWRSSEIRRS